MDKYYALNLHNSALKNIVIVLFALFLGNTAISQTTSEAAPDSSKSFKTKVDSFNAFMERAMIYIPVPIFSVSKETGQLFGLTKFNDFKMGKTLKLDTITQPSTASALVYYTQNKQFKFNVQTDLMFQENKRNIKSRITYFSFPLLYYGNGNDTRLEDAATVLFENVEFSGSYTHMYKPKFYLGLEYNYSNALNVHYTDTAEKSELIDNYDVTQNAGITSGFGALFTYEGRDNRLNAYKGMYAHAQYDFNENWTGSDFEYERLLLDVRKYISLIDSNKLILAGQIVGEFVTNKNDSTGVNIQALPALGGPKGMRGVYYGRYRDVASIAANLELRFPLFWIIGGVAFAGIGQVAPSIDGFNFDRNHYTYGGGLRLMISSKNRVNLRIDMGFSKDESTFVLGFTEAF